MDALRLADVLTIDQDGYVKPRKSWRDVFEPIILNDTTKVSKNDKQTSDIHDNVICGDSLDNASDNCEFGR